MRLPKGTRLPCDFLAAFGQLFACSPAFRQSVTPHCAMRRGPRVLRKLKPFAFCAPLPTAAPHPAGDVCKKQLWRCSEAVAGDAYFSGFSYLARRNLYMPAALLQNEPGVSRTHQKTRCVRGGCGMTAFRRKFNSTATSSVAICMATSAERNSSSRKD
eukprot:6173911-Pleurochrysis_carterae.AAC.2